ncbi:hypothetical protein HanHA300_Chr13g0502251 [Helianthus annuus]|nr:hypothetical protein HanHA300_Chr13g0502251 [Helianthus annuus]KAJ0499520.1 hypothetical protein HanHA89_Chr13g0534981 [Helianthus annuus]
MVNDEKVEDEEPQLFMAFELDETRIEEGAKALVVGQDSNVRGSFVWYLDSGCSNHMIGKRSLIQSLDESKKVSVRMGNGKCIKVKGQGTIMFEVSSGVSYSLSQVQYAPALGYNLLSVGQLMRAGYWLVFDDDACNITNKRTRELMCTIPMAENNVFPYNVAQHHPTSFAAIIPVDSSL